MSQVGFAKLMSFQTHKGECIRVLLSSGLHCTGHIPAQCVRSLIYWKTRAPGVQNSKKGSKFGLNTTGVSKCKSSCYPARTLSSCMISIMNKFSLPGVTL